MMKVSLSFNFFVQVVWLFHWDWDYWEIPLDQASELCYSQLEALCPLPTWLNVINSSLDDILLNISAKLEI